MLNYKFIFFTILWLISLALIAIHESNFHHSENLIISFSIILFGITRIIGLIYLCALVFPFKYPKLKENNITIYIMKFILLTVIFLVSFAFSGAIADKLTNYEAINEISESGLITYFLSFLILDALSIILFTLTTLILYLPKKLYMHLIMRSKPG